MPHATLPSAGFQAIVLCGPGASLNTFTSNPKEFPKALVPIANRPMIWYPLDWCYRMGVTDITLITPPESAPALESALAQNPHLTSLPTPKPEVLAPKDLSHTSGTGVIFRLPEVRKIVTSDFIVLPCDLICELEGSAFLRTWMTLEGGLGGATGGLRDGQKIKQTPGGEKNARRGGLGVWYPTKGLDGVSTKGEETDLIATTPLPRPVVNSQDDYIRPDVDQLLLSIPTDTVNDITEEKKSLPLRHTLLKKHGRIKCKTSHRDAHIYLFPYWIMEMMQANEFDSVAEDVLGWWAKAGWQEGLGDKLGLRDILEEQTDQLEGEDSMMNSIQLEDDVDLLAMSSTSVRPTQNDDKQAPETAVSRIPDSVKGALAPKKSLTIPQILAYVQPGFTAANAQTQPLIRRVDTSALLLSVSLRLAKLASVTDCASTGTAASPFAHAAKVAHPDMVQKQSRVSETDSLVGENVTIDQRVNIKESVIGVGCTIGSGSRLTRCLLMDGVTVGENVTLTGCILGRRCKIEGGGAKDDDKTRLTDCEVQGGYSVEWGTESKNEKFMAFEGLSDDEGLAAEGEDGDELDDEEEDVGMTTT